MYINNRNNFSGFTLTPIVNAWFNDLPWNKTSRYLPNEGFYPFPVEGSPIFDLLYVIQSYSVFIGGMAITAVDCFLCIVVFHACGQFDILAATLQRYGWSSERGCKRPSIICACLSCIVKRHVHLIK